MNDLALLNKCSLTVYFQVAWLFHKSRWPPFLAIEWPASLGCKRAPQFHGSK